MTDPRKIIEELVALGALRRRMAEATGAEFDRLAAELGERDAANDSAARAFLAEPETEVVVEHAALHELVLWAYSKLHAREFTRLEDALELDRMKLYVEHRVIA